MGLSIGQRHSTLTPDHPDALSEAITAYRSAWRAKRDEVDRAISEAAEPEDLVDQPEKVQGITRVAGPFTVEAVQPPKPAWTRLRTPAPSTAC